MAQSQACKVLLSKPKIFFPISQFNPSFQEKTHNVFLWFFQSKSPLWFSSHLRTPEHTPGPGRSSAAPPPARSAAAAPPGCRSVPRRRVAADPYGKPGTESVEIHQVERTVV